MVGKLGWEREQRRFRFGGTWHGARKSRVKWMRWTRNGTYLDVRPVDLAVIDVAVIHAVPTALGRTVLGRSGRRESNNGCGGGNGELHVDVWLLLVKVVIVGVKDSERFGSELLS